MIPPLIGVVQTEFGLSAVVSALLLGAGSISSGLAQPLFAWISDKTGSRIFGPLGVLLGGLGICFVAYLPNSILLFVVYSLGMIGVGMFHPIATARIGAIAGSQRNFAISLFFVFGMGGFFTGSLLGPWLFTTYESLSGLALLVFPGILMAFLLHHNINRQIDSIKPKTSASIVSMGDYNWVSIGFLYLSSVLRFLVNMAIIYLIVRWVEHSLQENDPTESPAAISGLAAPIAGKAHAVLFVGQGIGGLLAGMIIKSGKEKWPLIITPILFAPFLISLAFLQPGSFLANCACLFGGVGFSAMTPISIGVGQRIMTGHTRLASGLMLGGAWALGSIGPGLSQWLIDTFSLEVAIISIGTILMLSGLFAAKVNIPHAE